jgi:hypothetical protein
MGFLRRGRKRWQRNSDRPTNRAIQVHAAGGEFQPAGIADAIGGAVLRGVRGAAMRLLQNVDDPARFIQEIEYDTHEVIELNRQRVASDPQVQAYLRTWRSFFPGSVEIDVYQEAV